MSHAVIIIVIINYIVKSCDLLTWCLAVTGSITCMNNCKQHILLGRARASPTKTRQLGFSSLSSSLVRHP